MKEIREQIVYNMIKKELFDELIADIVKISVSKVKKMKKKLQK